jgi:endonuclease/exonuclease/phosphatase family metal-dependent hydrolase
MLTCGQEQCAGLVGGELLSCGLDLCGEEVGALSPGCTSCVIAAAAGGLEGMEADCLGDPEEGGEQYLYDCQFDTGILTRAEILGSESRRLDSTTVLAAVDYAQIATDAGPVDVFCTHLASGMPFDYAGPFGSWQGEQAQQMEQLLAFVAEKNDGSRPALVLGDLNNGPAIPEAGIEAEWPEHHQEWQAAGFDDPFASQADVACTLCSDNTFRDDASADRLLDHVLVKNAGATVTCERFMTELTTIDVGGTPTETNYSDHYGLVCQLSGWCAG